MAFLWEKIIRPVMFRFDAEPAHELGMRGLKSGLAAPFYADARSFGLGPVRRFGIEFPNPVGIAAGFDKNAEAVDQLASLGFGFVEVGTVTYRPQPGNPKPRMFRLREDQALINRLGFNNVVAEAVASRLLKDKPKCVVGINIGKNKDVPIEEATENYLAAFELLRPFADYIAINISSPNTPHLRELQRSENLDELLGVLQDANWKPSGVYASNQGGRHAKPLLVKIAPDLSEAEIEAAVDICRKHDISGIVATNTTVKRDGLKTPDVERIGEGGLSGGPLAARSTEVISTVFKYSKGKLPIIGVGGIFTAQDAFNKIAAGASLVQAYTGFIYRGPGFAMEINKGLAKILGERGFSSVDDAVGTDMN
jgi:dihydroorotate dehydrogenase